MIRITIALHIVEAGLRKLDCEPQEVSTESALWGMRALFFEHNQHVNVKWTAVLHRTQSTLQFLLTHSPKVSPTL